MATAAKEEGMGFANQAGPDHEGVKPNVTDAKQPAMYDPHTGLLIGPTSAKITSLEKHAAELQSKLEPPSCDHFRTSTRVEIHGHPISPYAAEGRQGAPVPDIVLGLERAVTAGLTQTADISLRDMAACAFGAIDVLSEPIVSTAAVNSNITELPTTSTLLHKSHIIPDMIDSLEETGISMDIQFGNVPIFNGMIVDRKLMTEVPQIQAIISSGLFRTSLQTVILNRYLSTMDEPFSSFVRWRTTVKDTDMCSCCFIRMPDQLCSQKLSVGMVSMFTNSSGATSAGRP